MTATHLPVGAGLPAKNANQTVAQAEARYRQAQATARSSRGAFFPTVDLSAGKTRASR